jgi:imidazolonepropionase-like amidohydrolase
MTFLVQTNWPMKQIRNFLLSAALMFAAGQLTAESLAPPTLIKAARLLGPRTGNVLSAAVVLIGNGKIKEVGAPAKVQAPSGTKVIDLGNRAWSTKHEV